MTPRVKPADHFKLFRAECRHWICLFGLTNWKVFQYVEDSPTRYAKVSTTVPGHIARIRFYTDKDDFEQMGVASVHATREMAFFAVLDILFAVLRPGLEGCVGWEESGDFPAIYHWLSEHTFMPDCRERGII